MECRLPKAVFRLSSHLRIVVSKLSIAKFQGLNWNIVPCAGLGLGIRISTSEDNNEMLCSGGFSAFTGYAGTGSKCPNDRRYCAQRKPNARHE